MAFRPPTFFLSQARYFPAVQPPNFFWAISAALSHISESVEERVALHGPLQSSPGSLGAAVIALSISPFQPGAARSVTAMLTPAPQTSSAFPPAIAAFNSSSGVGTGTRISLFATLAKLKGKQGIARVLFHPRERLTVQEFRAIPPISSGLM